MARSPIVLVVTSWDPNIQEAITDWLTGKKLHKSHARVSLRGSVKDRESVMKHIRFALDQYQLKEIHLINAEGDVAYADRKFTNAEQEREAHLNDLRNTRAAIRAELPKSKIFLYYISTKGVVEEID